MTRFNQTINIGSNLTSSKKSNYICRFCSNRYRYVYV